MNIAVTKPYIVAFGKTTNHELIYPSTHPRVYACDPRLSAVASAKADVLCALGGK